MKGARWQAIAVLAAVASMLGAACAPREDAKPAPDAADADRQGETVFDDVVETQDAARAVEAAAAERQRELQRTLEDAEGK